MLNIGLEKDSSSLRLVHLKNFPFLKFFDVQFDNFYLKRDSVIWTDIPAELPIHFLVLQSPQPEHKICHCV